MMPALGLGLLVAVGFGVLLTGLPAAVVLIAVACLGAAAGALGGEVPIGLLSALPERLINLLENDLLQAIPLYVLMGALINRLPLADALYRSTLAVLPRGPAAPAISGIVLGGLLGPMNGSVGASVLALSRVVEPRLAKSGIPLPRRAAVVTAASTLGVVVPPSLVLILLGDAMLSAHTIAVTATGRDDRVINTQDVFHGALAPAGLYFAACLIVAWWSNRKAKLDPAALAADARPSVRQAVLAAAAVVAILTLLGGVAAGYFYAVEAAAMGGFVLLTAGIASGHLPLAVLKEVLRDVMALTGSLFFLLAAATTLTLVLRILGTDQLVGAWIAAVPGGNLAAVAIVLGAVGLSALVLDAFEIIFVVVPIVIPPLLIRVGDARWVSVLVLLTLQTSFLNPLIGYAVMMTRTLLKQPIALGALVRALSPYIAAQAVLLVTVLFVPQLTHIGESAADRSRKPPPISDQDLQRRLREMAPLPELPNAEQIK